MDVSQLAGPIVLFLLMTVVGLELSVEDFRRVVGRPLPIVGGTLVQLFSLPLLTWGVVWLVDLNPVFAAGAILVAVSPGAGISNILVSIARANVALSVSLTALASVLAVATLPMISSLAIGLFLDGAAEVEVPVVVLIGQLLLMLLAPISLGMWIRARWPDRAERLRPRLQRGTMVVIAITVTLGFLFFDREQATLEGGGLALLGAALWTLGAMAIGWATARVLGLDARDRFTFLVEFSARNIAVSGIVALSGLGRLDLTFFSAAYFLVGYPLAGFAALLRRWLVGDGPSNSGERAASFS